MSQYQYHRINNGEKSCNTAMRVVLLDEIGTKDNFLINESDMLNSDLEAGSTCVGTQ